MKLYIVKIVSVILVLLCSGEIAILAAEKKDNSARDDVRMVLVPQGTYLMGSADGDPDEQPVHEVSIDSFYIDEHEVTVGQYKKFMSETGHAKPDYWQPELDRSDDPVVGLSWEDARAYAAWAGKRLPTEAEWGYAARGGSVPSKYPWGETPDPSYANFKSFGILPVKNLKPNGYGIYDMIGNVWEWCSDWYDADYYHVKTGNNPQGPVMGTYKVLRGGAWYCDEKEVRVANRFFALPGNKSYNIGFRCVKSTK